MASTPSQKDIDLLAKAWGICADTQSKVDYAKLAQFCGYKTAASATTAYCNAKKRFFAAVSGGSPTKTVAQRTPKSSSKKRAAVEMGHKIEGESDDEEVVKTPAVKKVKGRKAKGEEREGKVKDEVGEGEDGGGDFLKGLEEYTESNRDVAAAPAAAAAGAADNKDGEVDNERL